MADAQAPRRMRLWQRKRAKLDRVLEKIDEVCAMI